MFIFFDAERPSDSAFVERVWRCHSEGGGPFLSVASSHWELVVTRLKGDTYVTLRGPETKPREVFCPPEGEWVAIRFKAGTFMPQRPIARLIDGRDLTVPASKRHFRLDGSTWEIPTFDNAETFVSRLARAGILSRDPAVEAALEGDSHALSLRSAQRHFLQATGMSHAMLRQIERARHATNLLRSGVSIGDTVHEAGFFDQAHLTRSLKQLIGLTPARIVRDERQLSFLYKTGDSRRVQDQPPTTRGGSHAS